MTQTSGAYHVQKWGNSLAVRIPAALAKRVHFHIGTTVLFDVQNHSIVIKAIDSQKMSLKERLALFDPKKHGGEVMAASLLGLEKLS